MDAIKQQLIDCAISGDASAMAKLMEDAWQPVYRFMRGLGVPEADLMDIVQEALIRGMTKLHQYQPRKAEFHTWLCTIARNLYLDQLRKRKREVSLDEIPETAEASTLRDQDLRSQLLLLPPDVRFAILMHHVHGHTNSSIGRMLGLPEGTVKSKVFYGMAKLRKGLSGNE